MSQNKSNSYFFVLSGRSFRTFCGAGSGGSEEVWPHQSWKGGAATCWRCFGSQRHCWSLCLYQTSARSSVSSGESVPSSSSSFQVDCGLGPPSQELAWPTKGCSVFLQDSVWCSACRLNLCPAEPGENHSHVMFQPLWILGRVLMAALVNWKITWPLQGLATQHPLKVF